MGFLNNSTSNIILDAVLTDSGREAIARNDGSFSFVKFAAGDDEVDYNIIRQYGRAVGREKIEKNTPVLEATTNQNFAQKYRCVSISNPNLIRLPSISLSAENLSSNIISMGATSTKSSTVTISQILKNQNILDVELRDQIFIVSMSNRFLQIDGDSPDEIDGRQMAHYIVSRDPQETSVGGSKSTFTLQVKSIDAATFSVYGTASNKSVIRTLVSVTGLQSGSVLTFSVLIDKDS